MKLKGLNFFSVRNHNDKSYGKGREIDKGIYNISGFQIRFFTKKEIQVLVSLSPSGLYTNLMGFTNALILLHPFFRNNKRIPDIEHYLNLDFKGQ